MNELTLYGEIGLPPNTSQDVKALLAAMDQDEELVVRIDSPGGVVFEGFGIYNALKAYPGPKKCIIEAAAFSMASYIAMAFDEVEIAANGYVMIHNPSMVSQGDDEDLTRDAELLAKLKKSMIDAYSKKTGKSAGEVEKMLKAETYLDAKEAKELGLVSKVLASETGHTRITAKESLPYRVVASLFSAADGGETPPAKEPEMADSKTPVAASVKEIRAIYPQASSEFIVKCVEAGTTTEQVAGEALAELTARTAELESQIESLKADHEAEVAKVKEEAEAAQAAAAKADGNDPVAVGNGQPTASATQRWSDEVSKFVAEGMPRHKAVQKANRKNPGLRIAMIEEANAA